MLACNPLTFLWPKQITYPNINGAKKINSTSHGRNHNQKEKGVEWRTSGKIM